MNSLSGHIRQSIALIITIGIVLLALCLYFFVYVVNKEAQVNERNFRILSRTTRNLSAKVEEYTSNHVAKNIIKGSLHRILESNDPAFCQNDKDDISKCIARLLGRETKGIAIENLSLENWAYTKNLTKELVSRCSVKCESSPCKIQFDDVFKDTFSPGTIDKLHEAGIRTLTKGSSTLKIHSTSFIPIGEFISPMLRTDIFKDYVILEYNTRTKRNAIIYATNQLGIGDSVSSTIYKSQNNIATVELNGVTYLSFNYPFVFAGKDWLLAGLQKQEDYRSETRSLDRPLLYTLVLALMLLLLALPMIKVLFISKNEKLNKSDIVLCGLSLFLGCCFCSFIIITRDDERLYDHGEMENLAIKIEKNFSEEIQQMYNTILAADQSMRSLKKDKEFPNRDFAHFLCASIAPKQIKTDSICPPRSDYASINIHWSDSTGMHRFKWTNKKLTDKINVSDRGYFRNFKDGKAWTYPFTTVTANDRATEYVLESIFSWTELEKKAVVSKLSKVDGVYVVGLTKKLRSVIEPILPPGFKFCLADQQGNVWFHSDVRRNLNENIFEEIQMGSGTSDLFYKSVKGRTCMYENREHAIRIALMKNFPLFLITMQDLSLRQQSQAYTQELTFAFFSLQFIMVLLTIGLIKLTHRQVIKRLSVDWLKPDRSKSEQYVKIALLSLIIIVLFLLLVLNDAFCQLQELFFLFTIPLCTMPLFFLCLNTPSYRNYYSRPSVVVYAVTVVSVLALDSFFAVLVKFPLTSILVQAVILVLGRWFLEEEFVKSSTPGHDFLQNESNVLYLYTPAIGLVLSLIAILPTAVFFQHAFNYERKVDAMVVQFEFAKQFYSPEGARKEFLQDYPLSMEKENRTGTLQLQEDSYFMKLSSFASKVTTKQPLTFLRFDSPGTEKFQSYVGNRMWTWNIKDNKLHFGPEQPDTHNLIVGFTSELSPFIFNSRFVWLAGMAAAIFLLWLIHLLCSRIFLFKANKNLIKADEDLLGKKIDPVRIPLLESQTKPATTEPQAVPSSKSNDLIGQHYTVLNHLLLIGLPFSGKQVYLDILVPRDREDRYYVDIIRGISEYKIWEIENEAKDCQVIIVDHFEYDLENLVSNTKKLELLEMLFRIPNKKIVILSTIHPVQLFEACPKMGSKLKVRWHAVLAHFYKIICPLLLTLEISHEKREQDTIHVIQMNHRKFYDFIEAECNHGLYLHNLKITLYNLVALEKGITIEELVVKIRSLAYNYYVSVWNCCTLEEQHLIYDLAEDGVVNGKNVDSITRLVYKGIFVRENSLSLMNASFRDFVLSYVNPLEAKTVSENGNWHKMRFSLFFVLAMVAFFLLYSQKGLSNQIMGFITALAATLPLLFRVLDAVSASAMKKA